MYLLLGIPLVIVSAILETTLISRFQLLHGTADIVMLIIVAWALQEKTKGAWIWAILAGLIMGLFTGMPFFIPLTSYLAVTWVAILLRKRIWQMPLLVMLVLALAGTLINHILSLGTLLVNGAALQFQVVITEVTLPSILLNLLWALPIYWIISSMANRMYPKMDEV